MTVYNTDTASNTIIDPDRPADSEFAPDILFLAKMIQSSTIDLSISADNGEQYGYLTIDNSASSDFRIWIPTIDASGDNVALLTAAIVSVKSV